MKLSNNEFDNFKEVFEYALNKSGKPILACVDISLRTPMLLELLEYFKTFIPSEVIFKYRKIDRNVLKYRIVSKFLKAQGISYSASECRKRCGIRNFWEISVSAVLKAKFGFRSCCLNYQYPNKKGRPNGEIDKFVLDSFSWEKQKNQDYYNNRLKDFENLNKIKISADEIARRKKFKRLLNYLDTLK